MGGKNERIHDQKEKIHGYKKVIENSETQCMRNGFKCSAE